MIKKSDEGPREPRDEGFRPFRIDDVTPEMRDRSPGGGAPRTAADWMGTENGFYVYEENRPGLLLHRGLKYTLPPGEYAVKENGRKDYQDIILMDVDVLTSPEDDEYIERLQSIINSITT